MQAATGIAIKNCLSGPDGSRHSSDQHPKDVNSENLKYCPIFVRDLLSSQRHIPEVWNFCVFTVFEFLSHLPRNSRASRGRKFQFFVFFVFCGLELLRACLKAPALTGYVGGRPRNCLQNRRELPGACLDHNCTSHELKSGAPSSRPLLPLRGYLDMLVFPVTSKSA